MNKSDDIEYFFLSTRLFRTSSEVNLVTKMCMCVTVVPPPNPQLPPLALVPLIFSCWLNHGNG